MKNKMLETKVILLVAIVFVLTFVFGRLFEKIHIPGIFVALILGVAASWLPITQEIIGFDGFKMLSFLGMNFLLFLIGFEIDIPQMKRLKGFIMRS
ncbi:MAG: hypothetical protein GXP45_02550 [bacterium]|nr:hypothetical protein [bacterium]